MNTQSCSGWIELVFVENDETLGEMSLLLGMSAIRRVVIIHPSF
jgi:hypothetical protein